MPTGGIRHSTKGQNYFAQMRTGPGTPRSQGENSAEGCRKSKSNQKKGNDYVFSGVPRVCNKRLSPHWTPSVKIFNYFAEDESKRYFKD